MVPSLSWIPNVAASLGRALGCSVQHDIQGSVNQLVYIVSLKFGEPQSGKYLLMVWNIFQKYAAANDCILQHAPHFDHDKMIVKVGVKTKRGPARDESPW